LSYAITSSNALKAACLSLLDTAAAEHPAGHQSKLAARYVLRSRSDERIGLMFEKSEKTKALLWVGNVHARNLLEADIEFRVYLASSLYQETEPGGKRPYGRHAALKSMRDLANADLVRFTIERFTQMQFIVGTLKEM